jgi:structural maintenance of chromosome 4
VNTNADALKCIEYLKLHKLGRCTFSIVERVPPEVHAYIDKPFVAPKRSLRLFDLLKFRTPVFKPIFYNFLRDTLVAETLQEATYTAFSTGPRKRVVTLDGKLIEGTGVISGGGRARKGGMAA